MTILFVILAAECMDLLDGTVVNVAAPTIHHDLHTSSTALQWIVGGYALALAVGMLVGARLGDMLGRRRVFLLGVAGFTAASVLCGAAPSTAVLILARLAQGLAGAMMLPQGLGVIRDAFPDDEVAKAYGLFGPVLGSAAMLGPIVGGGLISLDPLGLHWRIVFMINLPLGLLATAGAALLLPRSGERHAERLDLGGALLAGVSTLAVVFPLIEGRELGWPAWTYVSIAGGILGCAALWLHLRRQQRLARDPLLEPGIFAHRGYSAGVLVMLLYFGGMVGAFLTITLFVQLGEGFSAVHAGLTLAPFALGTAIAAPLAAVRLAHTSGRTLIQAGTAVSLAGYGLLALILGGGRLSSWDLAGPLFVTGIGMGLFIVPAFDVILAAVSDSELGSASGVLNAVQQLGGAVGVAVLGTIFFSVLAHHGFAAALRRTMEWEAGLLAGLLLLTPLLPRDARPAARPAPAQGNPGYPAPVDNA